jgi:O-antigen/teichoic acid export membrane protein
MAEAGRTLTANSIASVLGTGLSALLSVLYISLGARWLGPTEYGTVGALISLSNVLHLALNPLEAGLTLSVAGFVGRGQSRDLSEFAARVLRALIGLSLLLLALWAGAVVLLTWLKVAYPPVALAWLGLFYAGSIVICLPRAVLRGREEFVPLSVNISLESALRVAVGLGSLLLFGGAASLIAGYAVATCFAVFQALHVLRHSLPAPAAAAGMARGGWSLLSQPFRSVSAPLLGVHLYAALLVNLDVLAAKHFLSARDAGLYAGAAAISRVVMVGATPLLLVLFSRLANLSAAQANTERTFRLGALAIALGLGVSLAIPTWFARPLLRAALGDEFGGAESVLLVQWASACVLTLQMFLADAMLATARLRAAWLLALPSLGLCLGLWLWHDTPRAIAQVSLTVSLTLGSLALVLLWRLRAPRVV